LLYIFSDFRQEVAAVLLLEAFSSIDELRNRVVCPPKLLVPILIEMSTNIIEAVRQFMR